MLIKTFRFTFANVKDALSFVSIDSVQLSLQNKSYSSFSANPCKYKNKLRPLSSDASLDLISYRCQV